MAKKASDVISAGVANNISEKKTNFKAKSEVTSKRSEAKPSEAKRSQRIRSVGSLRNRQSTKFELWITSRIRLITKADVMLLDGNWSREEGKMKPTEGEAPEQRSGARGPGKSEGKRSPFLIRNKLLFH